MTEQIITSSVLILAVCLIRLLFAKKISARMKYGLWLLVAVKLLVPMPHVENPFSVVNAVEYLAPSEYLSLSDVQYRFVDDAGEDGAGETPDKATGKSQTGHDGALNRSESADGLKSVLGIVWLIGVVFVAVLLALANLKFWLGLRRDRKPIETYKKLCVYQTDRVASPCLYGTREPAIYLPSALCDEKDRYWYILSHEYVHYKHGDHIWAFVRCACVTLYWYHPLVWLAAILSVRDGELACDEGTIRLIGEENRIAYGEALIGVLRTMRGKKMGADALICSTSMSGGMRSMSERMRLIAGKRRASMVVMFFVFVLSLGLIGCTFGKSAVGGQTDARQDGRTDMQQNAQTDIRADAKQGVQTDMQTDEWNDGTSGNYDASEVADIVKDENAGNHIEEKNLRDDGLQQGEVTLCSEPQEGMVCIRVEPSVLRDRLGYYYIPEGEEQRGLGALMDEMLARPWEESDVHPEMKEAGWMIVYGGNQYRVFEDGVFCWTGFDENNALLEYIVKNDELYQLVTQITDRIGYHSVDITRIRNIVSARLEIKGFRAAGKTETRIITDRQILDELARWFGGAEYIKGGADCCNQDACLELTLEDGEKIRLSMATDSCPNFGVNGVYYDYRPKEFRSTGGWYSDNLFRLFDESFVDHEADMGVGD